MFSFVLSEAVLPAPLTDAEFRAGREAKEEFGETLAPNKSDRKTMGMSCQITSGHQ